MFTHRANVAECHRSNRYQMIYWLEMQNCRCGYWTRTYVQHAIIWCFAACCDQRGSAIRVRERSYKIGMCVLNQTEIPVCRITHCNCIFMHASMLCMKDTSIYNWAKGTHTHRWIDDAFRAICNFNLIESIMTYSISSLTFSIVILQHTIFFQFCRAVCRWCCCYCWYLFFVY